jgi:hypothetical protein
MSATWDCHFYHASPNPLGIDDLNLIAEVIGHYKAGVDRDAERVRYRHPDTGVNFDVRLVAPGERKGGCAVPPAGLHHSGLVCDLPLIRPSLYGAEAVPVLLIICHRFRLALWHPGMTPQATPAVPDQQALMEAWLAANNAAIDAMSDAKPLTWKHEDMAAWYRYQLTRSQIETKIVEGGHDVIVPSVRLVRDTKDNDAIRTMVDWLDGRPQLFSQVDLVYLRRPKKQFFGLKTVEVTGWARWDDVRRVIMPGLQRMESEFGQLALLNESNAAKMAERLDAIPMQTDLDRFVPVTVDDFIDN